MFVARGCGGNDTAYQTVTVQGSGTVAFFTAPASACVGSPVTFTGPSSTAGVTDINWNFGDGAFLSGMNPNSTHTYTNPGTYTVYLNITSTCGYTSYSRTIKVYGGPPSLSGLNVNVTGATITYSVSATEYDSVKWFFGDGNTALGLSGTHTYSATGTYTVQVQANGASSVVRLFDGSGSTQYLIAQNANGTGAVGYGLTVDLSGGDVAVNFGNGLVVNLNGGLAAGTYTATVNFSKAGTYDVQKNGDSGGALVTAQDFRDYMTYLDGKLDYVAEQMSTLGAFIGRLNFKEDQVAAAQINVEAAYNRIMNANMAEEQVNASKYLILQQTATAMLAQANTAPQFLLSLFR
jgi:flagellin-like hook-associated protein FlgL